MLDENSIKQLISKVVEKYKSYDKEGILAPKRGADSPVKSYWGEKNSGTYPEYYDGYNMIVEQVEDILPHAERGHFPVNLFKARAPNQTTEDLTYIRNNFKQPTLSIYKDYVNTVGRAFNDGNYEIIYNKKDEKDDFRQYVETGIKQYGSLFNFIKFIVSPKKAIDANAIVVIRPVDLDIIENSKGEFVLGEEKVKPTPFIYDAAKVVSFVEDEYYIIEMEEKSLVDYGGGKPRPMGKIFEIYDTDNIWIARQVGKYIDWQFEFILFYKHDLGYTPVIKTRGIPKIHKNKIIYSSPFSYAVDPLDIVLLDTANLLVSKAKCVYPYRVILGELCDFEDPDGNACYEGQINIEGDATKNYKCPKCSGTGVRSRISPSGELLLRPKEREGMEGDTQLSQPPIQYVSPEIHTLEFLSDQIEINMRRGRKILHLETDSKEVNGAQVTATEKGIDLKATYAFIKPISDQTFAIYDFCLETIGKMREGQNFEKPTVHAPKYFDFKQTADYVAEIKQAIEVGMPPPIIHSLMLGYLNSMFYNQTDVAHVFNLIVESDRLLTASDEEIRMKILNGTAQAYEEILHTSSVNLISDLLRENDNFFELDVKEQKTQLIQLAKDKEKEIEDAIQVPLVDQIIKDADAGKDN